MFLALTQIIETVEELARCIVAQLPNTTHDDFFTYTYQQQSGISHVFLMQWSLSRVPRDYKQFLTNSINKTQIIRLILHEWKKKMYRVAANICL